MFEPDLDAFRHCRRELAACVVLTVLLALISLIPALTVGVILDRVIQTRAFATLLAVLLAFAIFYASELVFTYVHDRLMLYITHSAVVQAETGFWNVLAAAPYPELERLAKDDGLARFLSIGTDVRFRADWGVASAAIPLCLIVGMSALFLVSSTLCLPIAGLTVVFMAAHFVMTRAQRRAARSLQRTREQEIASVEEMLRGSLSLKAHHVFGFGLSRWQARKNAYELALQRWSTASVVQGLVSLSFERISLSIVLGVGAYEVVAGKLSVGQLVMANMLLRQISTQVRQVSPLLQRHTAFRESQAQMMKFLAGKQPPAATDAVLQASTDSAVSAHGLSFRTPEGRLILDGISFDLPPGQSLAILGESGSGKTTLLKLLSGWYAPSSGIALVHGVSPATRNDLVYLSQQEYLFNCGITDNVTLGRHSPNAAEKSLRRLDLNALLTTQPRSMEAVGQLSGGERQGIYIARAMVQPDAALFLDEPTTGLDTERRASIVSWLQVEARERQVMVFATHDSDLAQIADYVLRLSRGRLVDFARQEHSLHRARQQA